MRAHTWRLIGFATLLTTGVAAAQVAPVTTPVVATPPAAQSDPQRAVGADVVVSDHDKPAAASKSIERQKEILKRMLALLEEARNAKDVVKLNCVNEKLTQVKGLVRISEQSEIAMQEAISQKDEEVANHEFTKISLAGQRSEQLRADTESCVGELAIYSGDTVVVVEGDHGGTDPTKITAPDLNITRPPPASPFE